MKFILTVAFVHITSICIAQTFPPKELHFNHLNIENGLPENSAFEILKDKQGYIWAGTQNGLVRFDGYTIKQYKLSQNKEIAFINLLYEDGKSRFWAGTDSGLYQYDYAKDEFVFLNIAAGEPKSNMLIYKIKIDAADNIWIMFFDRVLNVNSLGCYDIHLKKLSVYSNKQKGNFYINCNDINDFVITNNNIVCVATENGLLKYEPDKGFFKKYILPVTGISAIRKLYWNVASPDDLWITVGDFETGIQNGIGCYKINNNSLHIFKHKKNDNTSLPANIGYVFFTDSRKQLWITTSAGLSVFHPSTKNFTNYIYAGADTSSINILINKAYENNEGNFWCAAREGLLFFNTHNFTFTKYLHNENNKDGLLNNYILSFLADDENVWAGGWLWGLQWVNKSRSKFTLYNKQPSSLHYFPGGKAIRFAEDNNGNVIISSEHGLYKWQPSSDNFTPINFTKGKNIPAHFVIKDRDDLLWISATDESQNIKGLYCYNLKTGQTKNYRYNQNNINSISGDNINYLYEDRQGIIWIGVEQLGICSYDKASKKFKRYPYGNYFFKPGFISDSLDQDQVRCITSDKDDMLWIGTNLGGINQYFPATQKFLSYKNKLPGLFSIMNCYCDNKGRIWAGTFGSGLFCFDKTSNRLYKYSNNFLFNDVNGITEDAGNSLWLTSLRGLTILDAERHTIKTITKANGLPALPHSILYKMKDGRMIYPCEDGFVLFNPADIKADSITPKLHIQNIIFNKPQSKNKSVDSTITRYGKDKIDLKYDENRITFNYVGLLYQNTAQIQYKYKLDGYDNEWVNANTQRSVTYTNLAPGSYTFHVTAANSDGVWSKKDDAIQIIIAPPFWKTWWFRTLLSIIICALVFMFVKYYLKYKLRAQQREFERLKEIEKVRSKISMDIHDEISSGLTKISLLSQGVKNKLDNSKAIDPAIIDKINSSSKEVINNLGEIIWAVNPKHDNLQSLLAYIRNYTANFFESTYIQLNINFPETSEVIAVSPDVKHNLFLVIKEALNNIIKHADANMVAIDFNYTDQLYQLVIKDNGKGLHKLNADTFGNGIANMKKRMEAINGNIDFKNENGTMLLIAGKLI